MKTTILAVWTTGALTLACALNILTPVSARAAAGDDDVKLTGCLVKGDGDTGYLLTNAPTEPSLNSSDRRESPSAVGTTGGYATVFYWLDADEDLKPHVGHRIEVEGELKGDLQEGEIELDRKGEWTELTVKAESRKMKATVPNTSVVADRGSDKKGRVIVRRVDVERVKMLGASCQS